MIGEPTTTSLGLRVNLERMTYPSIYEDDVKSLTLDIEFQTENRVRFKVKHENMLLRVGGMEKENLHAYLLQSV